MELCTLLLLFLGFIGCVIARKYAESLQYTVGCKFVLGPDADDASEWEHQLDGMCGISVHMSGYIRRSTNDCLRTYLSHAD